MARPVRAAPPTPASSADAGSDRAAAKGSRRGAADREVPRAPLPTSVGARRSLPRPRLERRPGLAPARTPSARRIRPSRIAAASSVIWRVVEVLWHGPGIGRRRGPCILDHEHQYPEFSVCWLIGLHLFGPGFFVVPHAAHF